MNKERAQNSSGNRLALLSRCLQECKFMRIASQQRVQLRLLRVRLCLRRVITNNRAIDGSVSPILGRVSSLALSPKATGQSGAVLIISLVMLLLLTLIGTTSMQSTSLEEKMVGNMRDKNTAFQRAEAALRAGEIVVATATTVLPVFTCEGLNVVTGGYYDSRAAATVIPCAQFANWQTINWTDTNKTVTYNVGNIRYAYYIEQLDSTPCPPPLQAGVTWNPWDPSCSRAWYRITARGVGDTDSGVVLLQSTYSRPIP